MIRGQDVIVAGAALIGVALAWALAGPLTAPQHVMVAGMALLALGCAWATWDAWAARRRALRALEAWDPDAVLTSPSCRTVYRPVRMQDAAQPGDMISADGRVVREPPETWLPELPPRSTTRHTWHDQWSSRGRHRYVVQGPRCPIGGIVVDTKQRAHLLATECDQGNPFATGEG